MQNILKKCNGTVLKIFILFFVSIVVSWTLGGFPVGNKFIDEIFFLKPLRASGILSPYLYSILILLGINVMLSVSLTLLNGFCGLFTMGHAGFMAVGAYSSASFIMFALPASAPYAVKLILGILIGGFVAAALGFFIGYSSLRLAGDYLGMVTLGFGEIIRIAILNIDAVGGARGMIDIPQFTNLFSVLFLSSLVVLVVKRIRESRYGRTMFAIKENEIAAQMMGINPTKIKVQAFVFSSFMAGIAGALFAHSEGYLSTQTFTFVKSFEIIAMNVIGGLGSISGAIVGGALLTVLPEGFRVLQDFTGIDLRMIIYALTITLIMIFLPQGLMGSKNGNVKEFKWLK
jgi:branched-chain amino acid transport system permease protein